MHPQLSSSTALQVFKFQSCLVRVVERDGEPLFVLSDACDALRITNVGNAAARLRDIEKDDIRLPDVTGRVQSVVVITEPGLYRLTMRSDAPKALEFQDWLVTEVLPSIRKTGSYSLPGAARVPLVRLPSGAFVNATTAAWKAILRECKTLSDECKMTVIARHTKLYGAIMDEPVIKTRLYTTTQVFEEAGVPQYHVVRSGAYKVLKKAPGNMFTQLVDVKTGAKGWEKWTETGRIQLLSLLRSMSSKIIDFDQDDV